MAGRVVFPLRAKFFLFAVLLAIGPLALVGQNLARITRDELKSAANEDLTLVASELRQSFDTTFQGRWLTPLLVIRNGIDSDVLDVPQKISLLTLGLSELNQVAALQLTLEGSDLPILATSQAYAAEFEAHGLDPVAELATSPELISSIAATGQYGRPIIVRHPATGRWMATLAFPLQTKIAGRQVTMAAKVDLSQLGQMVRRHPFAQRGEITVVDAAGRSVLQGDPVLLADREIVADTMPLIAAGARADALQGYMRRDGQKMLGAYAFPDWFPWAVITELDETTAYAVVNAMTERVIAVGLLGIGFAGLGAWAMARGLTRPILRIGAVAERVRRGDLAARVEGVRSRDEIGELARRFNLMISQLAERMELMKFVSHSTMDAIQKADDTGLRRGGARKRVSVIFTDIRGYTAFSESVPPERVIEVLNLYFEEQARLVEAHQGDVDKFIGDALVAVFEGEGHEARAVAASVEIANALPNPERFPGIDLQVGIGVASGVVVMGAMGARARMDYTVLGSTVNLAARLCSKAGPAHVLLDAATQEASAHSDQFDFEALSPIRLKGYDAPVPAFAARFKAPAPAAT